MKIRMSSLVVKTDSWQNSVFTVTEHVCLVLVLLILPLKFQKYCETVLNLSDWRQLVLYLKQNLSLMENSTKTFALLSKELLYKF